MIWQAWMVGTVLVLVILATAGGCRRRDVELVTVFGRVTVDGGPPPGPGTLGFAPLEALGGQPLRPATANFDADGHFHATSFDAGDGLVPARYQVCVHCWKVPPTVDGPPAESFVPARYMTYSTSKLELLIEPGAGKVEWNADLHSE
jgi:hypothetical protein